LTAKRALLIGNSRSATNLPPLRAAAGDIAALARVLGDPEIGGFDEVTPLLDGTSSQIRREIARFLAKRAHDDLLLLYFTSHGVLDERGTLHLAVQDTELEFLSATAIPAAFLTGEMDRCHSRRQILILDCCYSGAFERGAKGAVAVPATTFEGNGVGRVVLTASDSTESAWEPEASASQDGASATLSVFTRHLIAGLETGDADLDQDGLVTVDELYSYVYDRVVTENPRQTPGKWSYRQQGDLVVARHRGWRRPVPELPTDITLALDHPIAGIREGAVRELARFLLGRDPVLAEAARTAVERAREDDSRRVAAAATEVLAAAAPPPPPPEPARPPIAAAAPERSSQPVSSPAIASNPTPPEPATNPTSLEGRWPSLVAAPKAETRQWQAPRKTKVLVVSVAVGILSALLVFLLAHPRKEEVTEETTPATTSATELTTTGDPISTEMAAPPASLLAEGRSWPLVFAGGFDSLESVTKRWTLVKDKESTFTVPSQGQLRLRQSGKMEFDAFAMTVTGNLFLRVDINYASGKDDQDAGLEFRYTTTDGYTVSLNQSRYEFWIYQASVWHSLRSVPIANLHTGSETNTLEVMAKGPRITVFVNGDQVDQFSESTLSAGWAGLFCATGTRDFSNFEIRTPPPQPAASSSPTG
jgi:uncharacterized caspase-like protein